MIAVQCMLTDFFIIYRLCSFDSFLSLIAHQFCVLYIYNITVFVTKLVQCVFQTAILLYRKQWNATSAQFIVDVCF